MTFETPNTSAPDRSKICDWGPTSPCLCVSNPERNEPCTLVIGGYWGYALFARSRHPGMVQACMADGSVRSFSDDIDADIWFALGTRDGGEVSDSY